MSAAPTHTHTIPAGVDLDRETAISGKVVTGDGQPVGGAFVRLLDGTGTFTAEIVASGAGDFRFFVAPGDWTVRALSPIGTGAASVKPTTSGIHTVDITLTA
ncbi:DUF1416 domain-containing protein [Rhodococcus opacus]|uniref:DUF1416 domain-containing protein n=1 Tax=Rhodococcus opacus (strain B4) TaxID=632772 RepID=C1B6E5_RHOOB|nr:DUF1416 domain-containing protein [Rhodococcus opacus]BAH51248.1 hypothetical protein ROP_30010 [Rhodococcus opacus B4]